jgi:predicted dehydrogenase
MKSFALALSLSLTFCRADAGEVKPPIRLAIIGLAHDAVGDFILRARNHPDVQLVGIVESNRNLVTRYAQLYSLNTNLFSSNLNELLARTNLQAAAVFSSTLDHRRIVAQCAAHHLDVMLEKPLAVNLEDALAMKQAAREAGIQVIVDYETTWYPASQTAYALVHDRHAIGEVRKIVYSAGNQGPKETGCSDAFVDWLTNPSLNGGGALMDFGCYGADAVTWLMNGARPASVFAVSQHLKPDLYPDVEDQGTIVVTYSNALSIIQASWDLPFDQRQMEIYGSAGYVLVPQRDLLRLRQTGTEESELHLPAQPTADPDQDDLSYFAAVVRGEIQPSGPSSLKINLVATEILDAAKQSAVTGKQIKLPDKPAW